MKKQSLVKASLILAIAGMVTKFLGLFFRWPLIMLIGDEGIGYYQMSYPLYMFYLALASGIPVAISKLIAEKNAVEDFKGAFEVLKESFIFMFTIGTGMTLALLFLANPIIDLLKWDSKAYYSIIGIAFAPIVISFMVILRGFFQGMQNMNNVAVSEVIEQIGRIVIGVGLAIILLPKGIEFSAGGAAFGAAGGAIFATSYLWPKYQKVKREFNIRKIRTNPKILNVILKIAIPISLGTTVGTIMNLIDSIIVPQNLLKSGLTVTESTVLYAQLTGKAAVIVNIPLTLSMALCTSLVPIIAENYILKEYDFVKEKINMSIKIGVLIALPCMFGLFVLAGPIMKMIFLRRYEGIDILRYLSISVPFIITTQITTSILQATGNYLKPVFNLFIGCMAKVVITNYLVPMPSINIYGAVIGTVCAYMISSILNILVIKYRLSTKFKTFDMIIKPMLASVIMGFSVAVSYGVIYSKVKINSIATLSSIFIGIVIYVILVIILKIFRLSELKDRMKII